MTRAPCLPPAETITFDYSSCSDIDVVIGNLSGITATGDVAFTVSDEGRTVERLERRGDGFVLTEQLQLDALFPGLPDGKEADLESVDLVDGRLWLCGSHCRVRKDADDGSVGVRLRSRPSRCLLGWADVLDPASDSAGAAPFRGKGSLRKALAENPVLAPFMHLPSKENGLDIEGLAVTDRRIFLGLRGPVIDSHAVVLSFRRKSTPSFEKPPRLHMLDLHGLGVRDLTRDGDSMLVLADPVTGAPGPFRIYRCMFDGMTPVPQLIHEWAVGAERPEGFCKFTWKERPGLLVVYDQPGTRWSGHTVEVDWLQLG